MKTIQLTQGQTATVCDCHAHLVEKYKWHAVKDTDTESYYAARKTSVLLGRKIIKMHRVINGTPPGFHTDHIDGDTLNNQCTNLRTATYAQNMSNQGLSAHNTSGYKGVSWYKRGKRWRSEIQSGGNHFYLGLFNTPEQAARAYDKAALKLHGEFANTNFPKEQYKNDLPRSRPLRSYLRLQ